MPTWLAYPLEEHFPSKSCSIKINCPNCPGYLNPIIEIQCHKTNFLSSFLRKPIRLFINPFWDLDKAVCVSQWQSNRVLWICCPQGCNYLIYFQDWWGILLELHNPFSRDLRDRLYHIIDLFRTSIKRKNCDSQWQRCWLRKLSVILASYIVSPYSEE